VTIVTGFLGSGKTTQLNRALRDPRMRGAMVIVNEFGEVGLDHGLIESSSDGIVVLENGCLCCTVFGDLIGTLNNLYHRREAGEIERFDRVLIETSGLADPSSIIQAFLSDPTLEGLYQLSTVIVLADCINLADTLRNYDEAVRQLALADVVIVTKTDLVPPNELVRRTSDVSVLIKEINANADLILATDPGLDIAGLMAVAGHDPALGGSSAARWLNYDDPHDHGHGHAHYAHNADHLKVSTLSYIREEPLQRLALQLLLDGIERNLGSSLLRVKAIVNIAGEEAGPAIIQGAQHLLHNVTWLDKWPFADRKSRFVVIAAGVDTPTLRDMMALLDRIATRSAVARAAVEPAI
jgi:G3E family GTPase